jgi:peptidoglycan/xylan/chitin deacetylase (PgdA/CDA1 family)
MYHKIVRDNLPGPPLNYAVTESSFRRHMSLLASQVYTPLSIDEYMGCLYENETPKRNPVLITFDDGYAGVRTVAYPILKQFGFPAVVFVACDFIDADDFFPYDRHLDPGFRRRYSELLPLNRSALTHMQDLVSAGSHTMSHVLLGSMPTDRITYEAARSKSLLEDIAGRQVVAFSYPGGLRQHGAFNSRTNELLRNCGYKLAFNSEIGRNGLSSDPFLQKRIVVDDGDSDLLLLSKLEGSYDWARLPQWAFHLVYDSPDNNRKTDRMSSESP